MTPARRLLWSAIDPASLAAFRILFGIVTAASTIRFIVLGWIDEFYVLPTFHFTWAPFPWITPLPSVWMHILFIALAVLSIGIAAGYRYRFCAALFFVGFTYVELIDKTTYLNHYYLVSLLSALLVVLPANAAWSVDAWRQPEVARARSIPAWTINLLRCQLAIVYLFAGLAKLNADWLINAQPLRIWLMARSDLPIIGGLLTETGVAYAFSWFGAVYDLTIVCFLLWDRTRLTAYVTVVVFHVMTGLLFPIGMFPAIMIVATTVFFPPEWPRRWIGPHSPSTISRVGECWEPSAVVTALLIAYVSVQVALPLRAYVPGRDPEWTGRGFNFAWRVMIAEKAGHTEFLIVDPQSGRRWRLLPGEFLTARQELMMAQDPFMVQALARHIADDYRRRGLAVEVHAESFATLNARPVQRLIDPAVNLAAPGDAEWIVPLDRKPDGIADDPLALR